jgi:hypothetical protein
MKSETICAPKGHESIAQALAWVSFFIGIRPHKALPRSALLEKHPVRRVGGAEGATESRATRVHPAVTLTATSLGDGSLLYRGPIRFWRPFRARRYKHNPPRVNPGLCFYAPSASGRRSRAVLEARNNPPWSQKQFDLRHQVQGLTIML